MKTFFRKFSIILIILSFGAISCSKSDDGVPPPTRAELLAHKWFLVKGEDSSTTPTTVEFANECQQNTYYNFFPDGSLIIERFSLDMNSICVSTSFFAATYDLIQNDQQIYTIGGTPPAIQIVTIETLTETELVFYLSHTKLFLAR